jgi:hypothetical protein
MNATSSTTDGGPLRWLDGTFASQLVALGLGGSGHLPTLPAVVSSTTAVGMWMAFMLFKGRRRDDEPPKPGPVLEAAAASGVAALPGSGYVPEVDPESLMPRWRRPSLLEARRTDPIRTPGPAHSALSFATGLADAAQGAERRRVRYAVAPLLDRPDEFLGAQLGELVEGDEVQVEERRGAYCGVLSPDGRRGWVHRTTLGDVVSPDPVEWSSDEAASPLDAVDALAALLAARGIRQT